MKNMRGLREAKRITQKELSVAIGTAESTISFYESGKREPDFSTLRRLSEYFHVPIDFIIGDDGAVWDAPDLIQDYWHADDDGRLAMIQSNGIGFCVAEDYFRILNDRSRANTADGSSLNGEDAHARLSRDPLLAVILKHYENLNQEGREELAKQARLLDLSGEYIKTHAPGLGASQI